MKLMTQWNPEHRAWTWGMHGTYMCHQQLSKWVSADRTAEVVRLVLSKQWAVCLDRDAAQGHMEMNQRLK